MQTFCSYCGSALASTINFCPNCGTPTSSSQSDPTASSSPANTLPQQVPTDYGSPPYGYLEKNPYDQFSPYIPLPPPPPHYRRSSLMIGIMSGIVVSVLILGAVGTFAVFTLRGRGSSVGLPSSSSVPTVPTTSPPSSAQFVVQADQDWQNSGVFVPQGRVVTITYISGIWNTWPGANFGGNGCTQGCDPVTNNIIVGCHHGGLIGRIGSAQMICILKGMTVTATESGELYLRINDERLVDNSGAITVLIRL